MALWRSLLKRYDIEMISNKEIRLLILLTVFSVSIESNAYISAKAPVAFPVEVGPIVYNEARIKERQDISATVYEINPKGVSPGWWRMQYELLHLPIYQLKSERKAPKHWDSDEPAFRIAVLFGKDSYDNLDIMKDRPIGLGTLDVADQMKDLRKLDLMSSETKWKSTAHVLNESMQCYRGNLQYAGFVPEEMDKRYLITIHPPGHKEHVFMTMRVDLNKEGTVAEHRYIVASVSSIIAPVLYSDMPKYPERISMPMHGVAARALIELTKGKIQSINIHPLESMREILVKEGLINRDAPKDVQVDPKKLAETY